jgi:hypothetical protein
LPIADASFGERLDHARRAPDNVARMTPRSKSRPGEGRDFAPAYDPSNYVITSGLFPTANVFFADDLSSARTNEMTMASAGVTTFFTMATSSW